MHASIRRTSAALIVATMLHLSGAPVALAGALSADAVAPRFVPGRLLVQPKAGVSDADLAALFRSHHPTGWRRVRAISLHILSVSEAQRPVVEAALRADPRIRFVERDRLVPPALRLSDPYAAAEYHLARIGCPAAWNISSGSPNAPIAILDSGVDATHPDLGSKVIAGYNVFDGTTDTRDVFGHGTMVAGTAAAASDNGTGVASVAWNNPIMPIRVTDTNGNAYLSTLTAGLVWAADHGARIANISFAVFGAQSLNAAAQYFVVNGGVVFAAAGNDGLEHADAANPWVISVAATDANDQRADFSSTGPYIDLAAPGVDILTTMSGGGYAAGTGTSLASPIVAGVAGLLLGANPALTPIQIADLLTANAHDLGTPGYDFGSGWGRVDAADAVAAAHAMITKPDTTPPVVAITRLANGAAVSGFVTVEVNAADDVAVRRVVLRVNGRQIGVDRTAPYQFAWNVSGLPDGPRRLRAIAYDTAGNRTVSAPVRVTVANAGASAR